MRKKLYADASPPGRDNNLLVNNLVVNNSYKAVTNNNYDNNLVVNNYIGRTLLKMSPQYKKAGEEARKDPLGFRIKKVLKLLRMRLSTDNFIEATKHIQSLDPMEQAKFCQQVEDFYADRS
jgi:hypothetical protein